MNQRLLPSFRIRESSRIHKILTTGQKYTGKHLILYSLSSSNPHVRAAFLSPKRIGKATKRNQVRRRMREVYRRYCSEMMVSQDILLMGRTSAIDANYQALHDDFLQLCQKARLRSPT
jgi:ribonuclease P protein component